MKAAVLTGDKTIEIRNVPNPVCGPGQALIKVACTGICGTDVHIYEGEFAGRVTYPRILGHEFSGVVEAVADDVDYLAPGARVVVSDPAVILPGMLLLPVEDEGLAAQIEALR